MSEKLDDIIQKIADLTVLELSELVKALEEKFGVTAAAPMMMGVMPTAAAEAAVPEAPSSFNVILKDSGSQKIQVVKVIREITGLGLKESKQLVDECPNPVKENLNEDEAKQIREKLEAVGAVIEVKPVA